RISAAYCLPSFVDRMNNLMTESFMKQGFAAFMSSRLSTWILILVVALGANVSRAVGQDISATYVSGSEVPVRSNGFDAEGKTIDLALNFAPPPGTQLILVQNTGPGIIRGRFSNLAQGQTVALTYSGLTYHFVANYYGGRGNDLVLLWTTG